MVIPSIRRLAPLAVLAVVGLTRVAQADGAVPEDQLAAALAKHGPAEVTLLRAHRDDAQARCALGAVYAARKDLVHASFFLDGCLDVDLPDSIGPTIRAAARTTAKAVENSDLAELVINTDPDGVTVTITALPDETLVTPRTLWIPAGTWDLHATTADGRAVTVSTTTVSRMRIVTYLDAKAPKPAPPPTTKSVDFSDEAAAAPQEKGQPPDVKHKSFIRGKYAREVEPGGPTIDDPLAYHAAHYAVRPYWLGVRLGGGVFDDSANSARAGAAVAAAARFALTPRVFVAARLDYTSRGGALAASVDGDRLDTFGVNAGIGASVARTSALDFSVLAQLRGDVHGGHSFSAGTAMESVHRAGAGFAVGAEVAPLATPLTAGIRFEQGITSAFGSTRDRALLLELGLDWR